MIFLKKGLYIILMALLAIPAHAQEGPDQRVLTFEEYLDIVKANHPVAQQADNQLERGDADVLEARGAFDPKLFNDSRQKQFKGTEYYSIIESGLKIPTWFGIELQGGYDLTEGVYLNPQNVTPADGLWYGGLSVSLGEGLFIDERRAELQKAKIFRRMSAMERQLMLNELIYEAGRAYWDWYLNYSVMQTYEEALEIAEERFEAVRRSSLAGDVAAIDTTEARIQVQNNLIGYNEARLEFENSSELLSVYLWLDGLTPLEVAEGTVPENVDDPTGVPVNAEFLANLEILLDQHPELRRYIFKIDQLEVDRRWNREQLKPDINLKYNILTESIEDTPVAQYSLNNYTWGLQFEMPLFLRKERGKLRLTNIKIADARLDVENYRANLEYKAKAALNEWEISNEQIAIYRQTVANNLTLLEGERRMFQAGESSLFMVNTRQMSFINTQIKFYEYVSKNRKARLKTYYRLGVAMEEE